MTKNPFVNALSATLYITLVVSFLQYAQRFAEKEDSAFIPFAMLSLLVLSAATMACIFFFQPMQMYLDGAKKEATALLLKTIGTFAGITVLALITALSL